MLTFIFTYPYGRQCKHLDMSFTIPSNLNQHRQTRAILKQKQNNAGGAPVFFAGFKDEKKTYGNISSTYLSMKNKCRGQLTGHRRFGPDAFQIFSDYLLRPGGLVLTSADSPSSAIRVFYTHIELFQLHCSIPKSDPQEL